MTAAADPGALHCVGRWLEASAARTPDKAALDDRGVTLTYGELWERASGLGARLRDSGYGPGDVVATIAASSSDQVVLLFGCALAGVAMAPLSWRLTPGELAPLIERSGAALVATDEAFATLAKESVSRTAGAHDVVRVGGQGVELHLPAAPSGSARPPREVTDTDPLLIIFTSGSEAHPKGVVLTHANCFWNNLALDGAMPMHQDDVVLSVLPQFHVAAWNVQPLLAWWRGATVVLESTFQPRRVLQLIEQRGVTTMMGVPTQYQALADHRDWHGTDLSSLRTVLVGGAMTPERTRIAWSARSVPLVQGYGLTEAGPNVLSLPAGSPQVGAVGFPYPHVSVRLTDPETGLVLEGPTTGELWVAGPSVTPGYLGDAEATEASRDGDWMRTGDLARRDADGAYWIVDRLKDIYISGGENVAPAEVEQALERHPLIARAAVVGVPDETWGERGVAFVVPAPGAMIAEDEVLAHARDHLASFKVPVRVAVVGSLPRRAIDKVARSALMADAIALAKEQVR